MKKMLDYSNVITFLFTMGKKYRSRPVKVCKKIESMGAGEIVINSIDLIKKLNIPIRIAPKTKLAQIFYNYKILQKRSKSYKPEYEYNSDLVYELFNIIDVNEIEDMDGAPYLELNDSSKSARKDIFLKEYNLSPEKKTIFIHPGTGGSSKS